MIKGTTVTVLRPNQTGTDRFNNAVYGTPTQESVDNVLIADPTTEDMEAARASGVTLALTLHFPMSYTSSLRGCSVTLPSPWSDTYRVVGDPQPYMEANTPMPWNRPVNVEVAHG